MAATHALLTAHCSAGDHVVLPHDLYGGTYRLVDKVLARFGLEYDMVDQTDLDALERAVRAETRLIWVETPTNPLLNVVDIEAVVARKRRRARRGRQHLRHADRAAPARARRRRRGALGDQVPRRALGRGRRRRRRRATTSSTSACASSRTRSAPCPGPFDCFLVHRGLRTLHLRVAAHTENGRAVSEFLRGAAGVEDVRWPGFGGMVSFRHPRGHAHRGARREIFSLAESLGGVESLIEVPQAMTHQSVEDSAAAVPADLVRLSCGVEAAEDLVDDLRRAL